MSSKEWAVKLRPQTLEQMAGQESNKLIIQSWIDNDNLPNALIFYGKSGCGKALKNGTKVLTSEGYKPIEGLTLNDLVASNDGKFYKLNGIYPQGVKSCYKITLNHGNTIYASGDHIWTISRDYGKTYHDETTEEILSKGYTYTEPKTGWVQHQVVLPPVQPLEFPEQDLPIDPYLLGCLIGDGSFADNFGFSSEDQFIIDKLNAILRRDWNMELRKHRTSQHSDWNICFIDSAEGRRLSQIKNYRTLSQTLSDLGMKVSAEYKHIPKQYLRGSIEQRRALLAGLMDTDGYVEKSGSSDFTSVSRQLIQDVKYLAESLGIVTRVRYDISNWYSIKGVRYSAKPAHVVMFYTKQVLCTLPRKVERENNKRSRRVNNDMRIHAIERVEDAECTCISIQSPNHLFIAENRIPTHNTTIGRMLAHLMGAELVELDAASHNSVDDARQINELAGRLSLTGRHKIFLIDEAHQLSTAAFNVLLKNIEEPNPKVHFIFATTEYTKLPLTIRGRSRMLKFYSIPREQQVEYAKAVLEHEGYTLSDDVIDLVVDQSNGQMRDLLKLLQTTCEANLDSVEKLKKFLAIPDNKGMRNFINAVLSGNPKNGVKVLNEIDTDLLEWVAALQKHIYQLLEDKYGITPINTKDITTYNKIKALENKFTDRQFGALLTELNKINRAETAYAQLYALLFRGIDV